MDNIDTIKATCPHCGKSTLAKLWLVKRTDNFVMYCPKCLAKYPENTEPFKEMEDTDGWVDYPQD